MIEAYEDLGVRLNAGKFDSRGSEPLYWAVQSRGNNIAMGSMFDPILLSHDRVALNEARSRH